MANLELLTARELAAKLVMCLDLENVLKKPFRQCDFAIAVYVTDEHKEDLEFIKDSSTGWYGTKDLNTGFDSDNLILCTDYYGGGCARLIELFSGITEEEAVHEIEIMIHSSMSIQEIVHKETKLICEWR